LGEALSPQRVRLEDAHRPPAHAVTAPAEDDGVEPPREDPIQQDFTLTLVEEQANEEMHQVGRTYHGVADKAKETQLRVCETA